MKNRTYVEGYYIRHVLKKQNFWGNVNNALKYIHYLTYDFVTVRAGLQ